MNEFNLRPDELNNLKVHKKHTTTWIRWWSSNQLVTCRRVVYVQQINSAHRDALSYWCHVDSCASFKGQNNNKTPPQYIARDGLLGSMIRAANLSYPIRYHLIS
jgi:hypothetical protein